MMHYGLSEGLIKRVIRYPNRIEEGILENAIACMKQANSKKYSEIWTMYVITNSKFKSQNLKRQPKNQSLQENKNPQIKIITAWRYPGKSPKRNPVPEEILQEVKKILGV
ncbi:MAG: hypothetical protein A3H51_02740 [Candidatus Spechtbacteria bacterium RIFCSPLOWO2_02_FULL_38_8]|uniref:Uncharacterized protein n=1 Tax=Candidatus Spechtbacteria bacterium RIFCSPLOWO2_02_FULL_38_8 TaxID=1802164 RepID=A0A1G2HFQ6_9BACT|nr:MAG: hypothetical protein A3H51_02740 [Candidatus Spechtbacteria bacterium RIFCSPLOWO2_02_FULL_38_8]